MRPLGLSNQVLRSTARHLTVVLMRDCHHLAMY